MPPYCSPTELLTVLDHRPQAAELQRALRQASTWCDSYIGTETLHVHTHRESKQLRPDRDGRLLWRPEHSPFIRLDCLSYGRSPEVLTTYRDPDTTLVNDRTVVVDLRSLTASWTGSLQFGVPSDDLFTVWHYRAGYVTIPTAIRKAVALYGAHLLEPAASDLSQAQQLLEPYRWI